MAEGRGKSFTVALNQAICKAYSGHLRRKEIFWDRVVTEYVRLTSDVRRTFASIKARWSIIQKACNSYSGHLRRIQMQHQSGISPHDEIAQAKRLYKEEVVGKPFPNLDACWEILEHSIKFVERERVVVDSTPGLSQTETSADRAFPEFLESPSTFPSANVGGTPTSTSGGSVQSPRKRHAGCKVSKMKKGKAKANEEEEREYFTFVKTFNQTRVEKEARKAENAERRIAALEARVDVERTKAEADKTRADAKAKKVNDRIMGMDLNAIQDPRMRSYYELRQFEILDEMTKKAGSSGYFPSY